MTRSQWRKLPITGGEARAEFTEEEPITSTRKTARTGKGWAAGMSQAKDRKDQQEWGRILRSTLPHPGLWPMDYPFPSAVHGNKITSTISTCNRAPATLENSGARSHPLIQKPRCSIIGKQSGNVWGWANRASPGKYQRLQLILMVNYG